LVPSVKELIFPKDAKPLTIAMDLSRAPRAEAKILRKTLTLAKGSFTLASCHTLKDKRYIKGAIHIDSGCRVDTMIGDQTMRLGHKVQIFQEIDAKGKLSIGMGCDLGLRATTGSSMEIEERCQFKALFGMPIKTFSLHKREEKKRDRGYISEKVWYMGGKIAEIGAGTHLASPLVCTSDLRIRKGSRIVGSIKCHGRLILEEGVHVHGDLFAARGIEVGPFCVLRGNLFSQKDLLVQRGTFIGQAKKEKSVIGVQKVVLEGGVTIHGYVHTDGKGLTI
jgi:cytoskeletal protein CcmA (bactofilin family)